jgi:hypothetical protein
MFLNTIRRAQLISPFGPGALHTLKNGTSVITGGLDHWFKNNAGAYASDDQLKEHTIREWRLERVLNVSHFRAGPQFQKYSSGAADVAVPVLRFPTWFVCPICGVMSAKTLDTDGYVKCQRKECHQQRMVQVRFVAVCDHGHIQDFPWIEWVHRSRSPKCNGPLHYRATGAGSLGDIKISCDTCKKSRSLEGIMQASEDRQKTFLTNNLLRKETEDDNAQVPKYDCVGGAPWLGIPLGLACMRPTRAVLINATNVHYADTRSSIYLPVEVSKAASEAIGFLQQPGPQAIVSLLQTVDAKTVARAVRASYPQESVKFSDAELEEAIKGDRGETGQPPKDVSEPEPSDDEEFRRKEYVVLRRSHDGKEAGGWLKTELCDINRFSPPLRKLIAELTLVHKLRETRVFAGFSRLMAERPADAPPAQPILWRNYPARYLDRWLPATVVYGEGIFITLADEQVRKWETRQDIQKRISPLQKRYDKVCAERGWRARTVSPRFVLLHSFAHALINRVVYECGYGSASLRERLYVSSDQKQPMAGILIYTSSGDSDGTLGGLVRTGVPENFERILIRALEDARWCSGDPVCQEVGASSGQGPDSLSGAACHNCMLVPETSCEAFNRFLDRGTLIGDIAQSKRFGFFDAVIG